MLNILVIDDSASIRTMVEFTLQSAGFKVVTCRDGIAGVAMFSPDTYNLVLTDVNMPGMDGYEVCAAIRKKDSKVPILILTTESDVIAKGKGRAAGATGWLVKPFDPKRLVETVNKVVV